MGLDSPSKIQTLSEYHKNFGLLKAVCCWTHGFIDSLRSLYVYICGWELMLSANKEKAAIQILIIKNHLFRASLIL